MWINWDKLTSFSVIKLFHPWCEFVFYVNSTISFLCIWNTLCRFFFGKSLVSKMLLKLCNYRLEYKFMHKRIFIEDDFDKAHSVLKRIIWNCLGIEFHVHFVFNSSKNSFSTVFFIISGDVFLPRRPSSYCLKVRL